MVAVNNSSVFLQTIMYIMNQSSIQETSYNYYYLDIGKETNATKCYGIYGCFALNKPWTSENRPVSLFPEDLEKIEPNYPLYTRKNPVIPTYIDLDDFDDNSGVNPLKPVYIITHGYMEGGGIGWIKEMAQELLRKEDSSVIVVDWHGGSSPPYTQAVANIRLVGAMTAHLLADLAKYTGDLKLDHVHCIGHSLGAHLSGYVGYTLQNVFNLTLGRITGLDPAEPHFKQAAAPVRLDRSAAKFVDIIHTDASQFIRGGLGMTEKIGHVDYYPNGGTNQPGCGKSMMQWMAQENGSIFRSVRKLLGCNHVRSYEYFIESINLKCSFMTIQCSSYEDFVDGKCFDCGKRGEKCIRFGYHSKTHYHQLLKKNAITGSSNMVQYLITGPNKPFCRAHYKVTVKISDSDKSKLHRGEIGQISIIMHSTSDGRGLKSEPAAMKGGYLQPGAIYTGVVATTEIPHLKAIEVDFKYNSSIFNPLTWRIVATPRIYLSKITVDALEIQESITVCPKNDKPLIHGISQILLPSFC